MEKTGTESISRDTKMATRETLGWVEAVTGRRFSPEAFRENLEDGVALCELIEAFSPGSVRKINRTDSPMAYLDNIQQFLLACKDLGLRDEQLFNLTDLQEPHCAQSAAGAGGKRAEAERRLRNVCVTLYWLGRLVVEKTEYKGPQLDFGAFGTLLHNQAVNEAGSDASSSMSDLPSHPSNTSLPGNSGLSGEGENGLGLTFEEEQTADQLLADIQSAVDEMLHDFQTSPITMEEDSHSPVPPPPPPLPPSRTKEDPHSSVDHGVMRVEVSVHMKSAGQGKGFGFQVSGGVDTGQAPQVDMVLPGSAAELSGLRQDDEIESVNQDNVGSLRHHQLVATIRKAGREGSITLGLLRVQEAGERDPLAVPEELDWHEERERQAQELIQAYPKAHRYLESSAPTLTPVLEEEIGNYTADSPQLPLPAVSPEMVAVVSAKSSIEELRSLEQLMRKNTPSPYLSPPPSFSSSVEPSSTSQASGKPHPSPPHPSPLTTLTKSPATERIVIGAGGERDGKGGGREEKGEGGEEPMLTTADLESIIRDLQQQSPVTDTLDMLTMGTVTMETEGVVAVHPETEGGGVVSQQPWQLQTQWKGKWKGKEEEEEERRKKVRSFLEEKTRLSAKEMAQSVVAGSLVSEQLAGQRKNSPPKVLPKPVWRKKTPTAKPFLDPPPSLPSLSAHINGPIPSPDPHTITIQSTSSSEPLNVRAVTPEDSEIHGDIKIQKVAHTHWTPPMQGKDKLLLQTALERSPHVEPHPLHPRPYEETHPHRSRPQEKQPGPYEVPHTPPSQHQANKHTHPHRPHPQNMPGPHPPAWGGRAQTLPARSSLAEQTRLRQVHATPGHAHSLTGHAHSLTGHAHHLTGHAHHPTGHANHPHTRSRLQSAPVHTNVPPGHAHLQPNHSHPHPSHPHPSHAHPSHAHPSHAHSSHTHNMAQQQKSEAKFCSRTWGPRERAQFLGQSSPPRRPALALLDTRRQDGRQQAFLVRPTDPQLPCSRCGQAVGGHVLVTVPGLHLHYHHHCFACTVCRSSLVPNGAHSTTVVVRHMQPHCHFCTSDSQAGVQATEC